LAGTGANPEGRRRRTSRRFPRIPDWLGYLSVAAVLILVALISQRRSSTPPGPPAMPEGVGAPIAAASPFDPTEAAPPLPASEASAGTAFSVSDRGVWFTARHVVEGCPKVAIVVAPGRGVAAAVRIQAGSETAILTTRGGAPALDFAVNPVLRAGALAYHPGFPRGHPGEVASRLIGREKLVVSRPRRTGPEPVLAWAEIGRSAGLARTLSGLSGAPALDSAGRVIGVTIAQAPRRRRVFTTTPASLRAALAASGIPPAPASPTRVITRGNYQHVAEDLRAALRVVQVVCVPVLPAESGRSTANIRHSRMAGTPIAPDTR
jgi:serine protease Do